ncbi:MAG: RNA-binding protein [Candidatus Thermoplasmatota archaeon]
MELKNQHRLKDKEVKRYSEELKDKLGDSLFDPEEPVDIADTEEGEVVILDKELVATFFDGKIFPTIEGLLTIEPTRRFVTVDMGAVEFVYNGADIMAPGIVDADEKISEGDLVWIREVEHEKPLAVGRALTHGKEMIESEEGKVVKNLHHVGDGKFD